MEFVVRLETQHAARKHWQSEICTNMSTLTEMRIKLSTVSKNNNKILASTTKCYIDVSMHLIITFYTKSQQCSRI